MWRYLIASILAGCSLCRAANTAFDLPAEDRSLPEFTNFASLEFAANDPDPGTPAPERFSAVDAPSNIFLPAGDGPVEGGIPEPSTLALGLISSASAAAAFAMRRRGRAPRT